MQYLIKLYEDIKKLKNELTLYEFSTDFLNNKYEINQFKFINLYNYKYQNMGDYNQLFFAQHFLKDQFQSILEIGSKDYGSTIDFRNYFKECKNYIGVDMEDGKDVDVVIDLTKTTKPLDPNFLI